MDEKFIINRQGKDFVLYQGLLDEAHRLGLRGIDTDLVKLKVDEKEKPIFALYKAIVTMEPSEPGGETRTFTGYGEANVHNVGKNIQDHLLRMGETRAKARALRDAVNVGMVSVDELGGEDEDSEKPQRSSGRRQRSQGSGANNGQSKPEASDNRGQKIKSETLSQLQELIWEWGGKENGVQRFESEVLAGRLKVPSMSEKKAQGAIAWLKEQPKQAPTQEEADNASEDFAEEDFDEVDIDNIDGVQKGVTA